MLASDQVIIGILTTVGSLGVAGIGALGAFWLKRFDARNTLQHWENKALLDSTLNEVKTVGTGVAKLTDRFDHHIEWHAYGKLRDDVKSNAESIKELQNA